MDLSALLYGLLHFFDRQEPLRVRGADAPANAPRRWDGAVLATLKGAQSISKSGFTPQLRSGAVNTGIRHPLKFRPVNVVQAYDWRVCGADDHKTDLCPKLTATVLDTPTGQHPRTRALVSTAEVNGAFLKMHWRAV